MFGFKRRKENNTTNVQNTTDSHQEQAHVTDCSNVKSCSNNSRTNGVSDCHTKGCAGKSSSKGCKCQSNTKACTSKSTSTKSTKTIK